MSRDIQRQAARVALDLEELEDLLEERTRLVESLHLNPSQSDNLDLLELLGRLHTALTYLREDAGDRPAASVVALVERYHQLLHLLDSDPDLVVSEYRLKEPEEAGKKVRFTDSNLDDEDAAAMRSQLMGTAAFRPYRDEDDNATILSVTTDNRELFASHQQQLLAQDNDLDRLHLLVHVQNLMGHSIHSELDEQMVVLQDLENGVDMSASRLARANNSLQSFRRRVYENGSLVTIIVLVVILVLLLVVLN